MIIQLHSDVIRHATDEIGDEIAVRNACIRGLSVRPSRLVIVKVGDGWTGCFEHLESELGPPRVLNSL